MKLFTPVLRLCLALVILPLTASALLMRANGPEPVIIQIKESLRQSEDLDAQLNELASFQRSASLVVEKRWAGQKYLELVSFPATFSEEQANSVVAQLQQLPAVEKVVAVSGYNLAFRSGDFAREYAGHDTVPDVARRGFDVDRLSRPATAAVDIATKLEAAHLPNRIIVRWKDEHVWKGDQTGWLQLVAAFNAVAGCVVVDEFKWGPNKLVQVMEFNAATGSVADKLVYYQASEWVDYVQPSYVYSTNDVRPSDQYYSYQWGLEKIFAPRAWDPFFGNSGSDDLKVAVGDTGANFGHPDLVTNHAGGMNFVPPALPTAYHDVHGHGTHVASILGAQGNNAGYIAGTAWNVGLLHAKVLGDNGSGSSETIVNGIRWAAANGAHTMNLSLGSDPMATIDTVQYEAIKEAREKGMVIVAAAGNGYRNVPNSGVNSDEAGKLVNPASIPTDNMIAVGATDQADNRPLFSNYGSYRVELGAPGVDIYGLHPNLALLVPFSGTSQAAPHVAGVLQLVKNKYRWENYAGIRDRVLMSTDNVAAGFRTGRLNAGRAMAKRTMVRNLSTRGKVENGDRIIIGGFYVGGDTTGTQILKNKLKVAIRGMGPSLPALSVPRLNDPKIRLNNLSGAPIGMNDDWGTLPPDQKGELIANGLAPTISREAAMVVELEPGGYTVFVESQDGQFGVGMFEIYEIEGNRDEQARLLNVSTRCPVGIGDEVAIAGTILGNPSEAGDPNVPNRRMLAFAKGPSIPMAGSAVPLVAYDKLPFNKLPVQAVAEPLNNPYLELHGSSGLIASNDQWRTIDGSSTGLEDKLVESRFAPTHENEAALWPLLRPGNYTAILRDPYANASASGVGLVEFFEY
jgi:subtilisin family serine protease